MSSPPSRCGALPGAPRRQVEGPADWLWRQAPVQRPRERFTTLLTATGTGPHALLGVSSPATPGTELALLGGLWV